MLQKTKLSDLPSDDWHDKPLQQRPGFLIRRLHQIHVALFIEECGSEKITPVQYSILSALDQMGSAEQIALCRTPSASIPRMWPMCWRVSNGRGWSSARFRRATSA